MKTISTAAAALVLTLGFHLLAMAEDPRAAIANDHPNLQVRSGLANLKHRVEVDKKCHVAFLGGSITENKGGHTAMVPAWLENKFPEVDFSFTNAGWGSTCSTSGAFRVESQIFSKGDVDLLIIEFAVNDDQDAAHAKRECIRGMEGIIRRVRRDHPKCDILMVHYVNPGMLAKIQRGEIPISIAAHEAVAEHYGVISVNVAAEVAAAASAGRYTWKDYGGTHPGKFGYEVASNMIIAALDAGMAKAERPALRKPLDANSYDRGSFVHPKEATVSADWKIGKVGREILPLGGIRSQYERFEVLRSDKPGAELSFDFEGLAVGAFVLAGPDAGIVEASIDGGEFKKIDLFHRHSGGLNYPRSVMFATDLEAGKHELKLRISAERHEKSKGHAASILFFEVNASAPASKELTRERFEIDGHMAFVILPEKRDGAIPWVFYAPSFDKKLPSDKDEGWMMRRFLDAGIAIAGVDVGESYGSPAGQKIYTALHRHVVEKFNFQEKANLLARSRGGLMLYGWAVVNPEKVRCIAGIYPVCDLSSYPGLAKACAAFELKEEELRAQLDLHNPIPRLEKLAEANVPIFHIHGDKDKVVPLAANSAALVKRYKELGGDAELVIAPDQWHNMWRGFFECQELVDFVIKHAQR